MSTFSVYRKIEGSPDVAVHGQVATKPQVVELILDLVGYTIGPALIDHCLLDPGCGEGAFVLGAAQRLLASIKKGRPPKALAGCLLGIERDSRAVEVCRTRLVDLLRAAGVDAASADELARGWVVCADFLDYKFDRKFRFVVGNPPYVRQEAIPKEDLLRYRRDFDCFYDRADLYVAFFERGLRLLDAEGMLGFICPDRFARNNYGRKLRALISSEFSVKTVLDLTQASPFLQEVTSYPGIFVIGRQLASEVDYFRLATADAEECREVSRIATRSNGSATDEGAVKYHRYEKWFTGEDQWTLESPAHLDLLRRLETENVPLGAGASGCKVGIGVATGADRVFIVRPEEVQVEAELLVPLVMTDDVATGEVIWSGRCVINPFRGKGSGLIDLSDYPKLAQYFDHHKETLRARNVASRNEHNARNAWYRTIDRIYPELLKTPKLLIPDIKAKNIIALDEGKLYPHHNLYYVASESWDLRALRSILRSSVARFFVWMYGVKMRGNFLRFQAQYLKKICIPLRMGVKSGIMAELARLSATAPIEEVDEVVSRLYGLSQAEVELIRDITGVGEAQSSPRTRAVATKRSMKGR